MTPLVCDTACCLLAVFLEFGRPLLDVFILWRSPKLSVVEGLGTAYPEKQHGAVDKASAVGLL